MNYDTPEGEFKESVDHFRAELAKHDVKLSANVTYFLDTNKFQESARTMIAKLRDADVTTVIFAGDPLTPIYLTKEATAQGWFPEWIPTGTLLDDTNFFARQYDRQQWSHAFGAVSGPVRVPQEQYDGYAIWKWAYGSRRPRAPPRCSSRPGAPDHDGHPPRGSRPHPRDLPRRLVPLPAHGRRTDPTADLVGLPRRWEPDYAPFDDATEIWFDATATGKRRDRDPGDRPLPLVRRRQAVPDGRVARPRRPTRSGSGFGHRVHRAPTRRSGPGVPSPDGLTSAGRPARTGGAPMEPTPKGGRPSALRRYGPLGAIIAVVVVVAVVVALSRAVSGGGKHASSGGTAPARPGPAR